MTLTRRVRRWFPHLPAPAVGLSTQGLNYRLAWISATYRARRYLVELQRTQVGLRELVERLDERKLEFQAEARYAEQNDAPEDQTMNHMVSYELNKIVTELDDLLLQMH